MILSQRYNIFTIEEIFLWKFYFSVEKCDSGVEDFICRDFLAGQGYIV